MANPEQAETELLDLAREMSDRGRVLIHPDLVEPAPTMQHTNGVAFALKDARTRTESPEDGFVFVTTDRSGGVIFVAYSPAQVEYAAHMMAVQVAAASVIASRRRAVDAISDAAVSASEYETLRLAAHLCLLCDEGEANDPAGFHPASLP